MIRINWFSRRISSKPSTVVFHWHWHQNPSIFGAQKSRIGWIPSPPQGFGCRGVVANDGIPYIRKKMLKNASSWWCFLAIASWVFFLVDPTWNPKANHFSKKTPTDPWNIPQTLNYLLMKEILSYLYFGISGVCSRDLLDFS